MREQILAMQPGRELDNLVATKVMGWENKGQYWMDKATVRTWEETSYKGFQPSNDIAAAFEVLEKLKPQFTEIEVYWWNEHWEAWFGDNEVVKCETAPHAISIAALLAVMEE